MSDLYTYFRNFYTNRVFWTCPSHFRLFRQKEAFSVKILHFLNLFDSKREFFDPNSSFSNQSTQKGVFSIKLPSLFFEFCFTISVLLMLITKTSHFLFFDIKREFLALTTYIRIFTTTRDNLELNVFQSKYFIY